MITIGLIFIKLTKCNDCIDIVILFFYELLIIFHEFVLFVQYYLMGTLVMQLYKIHIPDQISAHI